MGDKIERIIKVFSFTVTTFVFTFIFWFGVIYDNVPYTTALILGGVLMVLVLVFVYFFGHRFNE